MQITEQVVKSRTGKKETCEDAIFANEHFIAIIDGATSKTDKRWNGRTPGQVAKDLVMQSIEFVNPNSSADKFFLAINESIKQWYEKEKILIEMEQHITQRCTASLIVYSRQRNQVWILGNGFTLIGDKYINAIIPSDILASHLRSYYIQTELRRGVTEYELMENDTSRDFILPVLKRQVQFQNSQDPSEFDYYAIDGFYVPPRGIQVFDVPPNTEYVVMASDGYPEVYSSLEKSEKYLAQILKEDPLLYKKHKSVKGLLHGNESFDDRSYVKIKLIS
jgi:glycerophosphoryl diester phosphodiesterase